MCDAQIGWGWLGILYSHFQEWSAKNPAGPAVLPCANWKTRGVVFKLGHTGPWSYRAFQRLLEICFQIFKFLIHPWQKLFSLGTGLFPLLPLQRSSLPCQRKADLLPRTSDLICGAQWKWKCRVFCSKMIKNLKMVIEEH